MNEQAPKEVDKLHIAMTKRDGWLEGAFPYTPTVLIGMAGLTSAVIFDQLLVSFLCTIVVLMVVGYLFSKDQDLLSILRIRLKIFLVKLWFSLKHNLSFCRGRRYRP